jgi:hypothetical protein
MEDMGVDRLVEGLEYGPLFNHHGGAAFVVVFVEDLASASRSAGDRVCAAIIAAASPGTP